MVKSLRVPLLLLTVAMVVFGAFSMASAQTPNLTHTIAKVSQAPTIDGNLSDATWLQASLKGSKLVSDISHDASRLTPYPRVAYLAYDESALYVGVIVYAPDTSKLVTNMPAASHNDEVEVFLAPDNNGYHQFIITAGGDIAHNTRGVVKNANAEVEYEVSVTDIKWTLELAIPFESLGHTPSAGDEWKININGRQVGAGDQWLAWNPTYGGFHNDARFGNLVFGE